MIMDKVYNNLAPIYLHELFQMRAVNLDNTASNLRSVAHKNYLSPQAKCNLFKGSFSYSGVVVWNSNLTAGAVQCGGRKTSPRTSTIVQFIIYFGPLRSA